LSFQTNILTGLLFGGQINSQRVTETAVATAKELNLSEESIEKIRLAGLIHDIGKIGVKGTVLNKPGGLIEEEYQHIKSHPGVGEHILNPIVDDEEILKIVRHHHERYDGNGYPDGLKGEQIPLGARILAVADTYDAMTSERPYREAMSIEVACAEIKHGKGTQFDPAVADAFFNVFIFGVTLERKR
jgi:HD-GYP domain-containing protein (c-di-GMP phosphodiesterase class II)